MRQDIKLDLKSKENFDLESLEEELKLIEKENNSLIKNYFYKKNINYFT